MKKNKQRRKKKRGRKRRRKERKKILEDKVWYTHGMERIKRKLKKK
jgi:hypothetical protein